MDKKDARWYETSAQTRLDSAKSVSDYRGVLDDCKQGLDLCDHKTAECATCANLYLICAQAYIVLGEGNDAAYDLAKKDCDRAERLGCKDATFYRVRAKVYLGFVQGAVRCLKEAIDDCDSGLKLCEHSTAKCSVCAELYNLRAQAVLYPGGFFNKEKALEICRKGLELDGDNAGLYMTRAQAYKANYHSALQDICYAIELDSTAPIFFFIRATIHKSQGELEKARIDCERAVKLYEKQGFTESARVIRLECKDDTPGESPAG